MKLMRKLILPACLLLYSLLAKAQESKWAVTFTPAVTIYSDFKYAWQPGVEYRFNDRLSLLTEIAFTTDRGKDPNFSNNKFFRIKPELRFYSSESKHGLRNYVGLQLAYVYRKWNDPRGGCYFDKKMYADSITKYDKATINSPVLISTFQIGTPFSFGDHFGMDIFIGFGIRMIFTKYSHVENATKQDYYYMRKCGLTGPDPAWQVNGTVTRFHMNPGFRLFYRF